MVFTIKQLDELEAFFKKTILPASIQLDEGSKILDVTAFIDSHLKVLRNNFEKPVYEVFYSRLLRLKEILLIKP
jgi:hypothetical protein